MYHNVRASNSNYYCIHGSNRQRIDSLLVLGLRFFQILLFELLLLLLRLLLLLQYDVYFFDDLFLFFIMLILQLLHLLLFLFFEELLLLLTISVLKFLSTYVPPIVHIAIFSIKKTGEELSLD